MRVVIADPRESGRAALRRLVEEWRWVVVGEAETAAQARDLATDEEADLLVVDHRAERPGEDWGGAPMVVRLLDSPHQHAARAPGLGILKGVPADHIRTQILAEWRRRADVGDG